MAVFEYRGILSATGKQVRGVRDADNAKTLRSTLKREGILLANAHENKSRAGGGKRALATGALFRRVSPGDVAMMTRQLATLVTAGNPLVEAVPGLNRRVQRLER